MEHHVTARDFSYNNNNYEFGSVEEVVMILTNKGMWEEFNEMETEMIITKSGRRMFPALNVKLLNLDPKADYCLYLELQLAHRCRFKYSPSVGWSPVGHEEAQSPQRLYIHPESPSKGSHWMNQEISFSRVKLTNTCSPPDNQIVLSSMHKYQPRILIVKSSNPHALGWAPTKSFIFPETKFVAVTAYQNEKITKLKITYNPFAKGFRENGKSNMKRKSGEHLPDSPSSKKSSTPSPPPEINEDMDRIQSQTSSVPHQVPSYRCLYPFYPSYHEWWRSLSLYYPSPYFETPPEEKEPKKLTDFSINAIIGN